MNKDERNGLDTFATALLNHISVGLLIGILIAVSKHGGCRKSVNIAFLTHAGIWKKKVIAGRKLRWTRHGMGFPWERNDIRQLGGR